MSQAIERFWSQVQSAMEKRGAARAAQAVAHARRLTEQAFDLGQHGVLLEVAGNRYVDPDTLAGAFLKNNPAYMTPKYDGPPVIAGNLDPRDQVMQGIAEIQKAEAEHARFERETIEDMQRAAAEGRSVGPHGSLPGNSTYSKPPEEKAEYTRDGLRVVKPGESYTSRDGLRVTFGK